MVSNKDISIRNKLVLMQVFTSVIVLGIFFGVYIITDIRDYRARKVKSMTSLAHVIATNTISTLQFQDNEAARSILAELRNVAPEIVYAGITDKKKKLFASYKKEGTGNPIVTPPVSDKKYEFSGKDLFINHDINNNGEIIGKVTLQIEMSELEAIKAAKYEIATILLLISVGFSFVIALLLQPYISKRLLYLVNTMKQVSATGDYNNVIKDEGKDEISVLIRVFNDLMEQVKENQRRKDEFIGIASHELRTPLTSIKGYLDLLDIVEDRQPNKQFVQKSLDSVHKLEKLIKDLLDVSKIQSGQLQLEIKEFDINDLIEETIASFQLISSRHRIINENGEKHQLISADRQRIEQVLINLLSNAIKYSPGQDKVLVSTEKTGAELIIRVRDFGIGIPKEELSNIFGRFYRTKNSMIHISGFGLGLYICSDIVARHHGRIWAEREFDGTSFYVALPLAASKDMLSAIEPEIVSIENKF